MEKKGGVWCEGEKDKGKDASSRVERSGVLLRRACEGVAASGCMLICVGARVGVDWRCEPN
jgi:hypothetical protein